MSEMDGYDVVPVTTEVLDNESAVAVLWFVLAAKQNRSAFKDCWVKNVFDAPLLHQREESVFVL